MLIIRAFAIGLLAVGLSAAFTAQAGVQMYQGSWRADSFGNTLVTPDGTGEYAFWFVVGIPRAYLCNPQAPLCNFSSTPASVSMAEDVVRAKNFKPLGPYCVPYSAFADCCGGLTMRPDKFGTPKTTGPLARPIPPLYRAPAHFTEPDGKLPLKTLCDAASTINAFSTLGHLTESETGPVISGPGPNQGVANFTWFAENQPITTNDPRLGRGGKGKPVTGSGTANTTTPMAGGAFTIPKATGAKGMQAHTFGEFQAYFPYLYSYTYGDFSNDAGNFAAGGGFFTKNAPNTQVSIPYKVGDLTVGKVVVTEGANRFGGTMKMLGAIRTKACFFSLGGCFLGSGHNWRYEVIGAGGYSNGQGTVTEGKIYEYALVYYHTLLMQSSPNYLSGDRFPWTTGSVTLTAVLGVNKTIERRRGYDNRTDLGRGTIQLVSPLLTHWISPGPGADGETGGIGVLRIKMPEPQKWLLLAAGLSLLGGLYRIRGR